MQMDTASAAKVLQLLASWMAQGKATGSPAAVKEVLRHIAFSHADAAVSRAKEEDQFVSILEQSARLTPGDYQTSSGESMSLVSIQSKGIYNSHIS